MAASFAPSTLGDTVTSIIGWKKSVQADGSFGRITSGPMWLDGVAIRDGVISGAKLKATLVISNTFTTADTTVTPTADRVEMTASGIKAYGTVSGIANTQTLSIGNNGDFTFGSSGSNPITYVASTGTLTVPAAVIGSLTIANVGSGLIGGTYKTANTGAHLEIDTSGIRAYSGTSTKTFDMVASSGDLNLTGNLTVGSGGKIKFGGSAADYLDNNILHFEVSTSEESVIEIKNGSNTPYGAFAGLASSTDSRASVQALASATRGGTITAFSAAASGTATLGSGYDGTHYAQVTSQSLSTYATITDYVINGTTGTTGWSTLGGDTAASSYSQCQINGSAKVQIYASGTYINNNLYPGGNNSDYLTFASTSPSLNRVKVSGYIEAGGLIYPVGTSGGSGALPNPTKYTTIVGTNGTTYYIPLFTNNNAWTA